MDGAGVARARRRRRRLARRSDRLSRPRRARRVARRAARRAPAARPPRPRLRGDRSAARRAAARARRSEVPGSPFDDRARVPAFPGWKETALWWPERRTLVVERGGRDESLLPSLRGRRLGVNPVLRLLRPPTALLRFEPEHLLVRPRCWRARADGRGARRAGRAAGAPRHAPRRAVACSAGAALVDALRRRPLHARPADPRQPGARAAAREAERVVPLFVPEEPLLAVVRRGSACSARRWTTSTARCDGRRRARGAPRRRRRRDPAGRERARSRRGLPGRGRLVVRAGGVSGASLRASRCARSRARPSSRPASSRRPAATTTGSSRRTTVPGRTPPWRALEDPPERVAPPDGFAPGGPPEARADGGETRRRKQLERWLAEGEAGHADAPATSSPPTRPRGSRSRSISGLLSPLEVATRSDERRARPPARLARLLRAAPRGEPGAPRVT